MPRGFCRLLICLVLTLPVFAQSGTNVPGNGNLIFVTSNPSGLACSGTTLPLEYYVNTTGSGVDYFCNGNPGVWTPFTSSGSGTPTGAAGGDLTGTYPNPGVGALGGVPLCSGVTPANGQAITYTTASSPNPCLTYATGANGNAICSAVTVSGGGVATYPSLASCNIIKIIQPTNQITSIAATNGWTGAAPTGAVTSQIYYFEYQAPVSGGFASMVCPTTIAPGYCPTLPVENSAIIWYSLQWTGTSFQPVVGGNTSGHGIFSCVTAPGSAAVTAYGSGTGLPFFSSADNCDSETATLGSGTYITYAEFLKGADCNPVTGICTTSNGVPIVTTTGSQTLTNKILTSPTLTSPVLGTPASGNATNLTNLPIVLTTTSSSGAATYTQATNTLNIPIYAGGSGCNSGSTTNLLKGDGAGGCGDSTIQVATNEIGIGGAPFAGAGVYINDVGTSSTAFFGCNNGGTVTTRCNFNFYKNGNLAWGITNDLNSIWGLDEYTGTSGSTFLHNIWAFTRTGNLAVNNADGAWKWLYATATDDGTGANVQVKGGGISWNNGFIVGSSTGVISLKAQAAAGTYNWNWPITAGTSGQPLLSGGGSTTAMNWGNVASAFGGTGVSNTATITLGSSNVNLATLGTGIVKNTTTIGNLTNAAVTDVTTLFSGGAGCTGSNLLAVDGTCQTGVGGAPTFSTISKTANYTALASDFSNFRTILISSGTFTVTLVAVGSQPSNGQGIWVVNYGSGVITISPSGQNINGAGGSLTIPAGSATAPNGIFIVSDGSNYFAQVLGASSAALTGGGTSGWSVQVPASFIISTTQYAPWAGGGGSSGAGAESTVQTKASSSATITGVQCSVSPNFGASTGAVISLRDGGTSETPICTIAAGGTIGVSSGASFNITAGDLVDWQIALTGSTATNATPQITILYAVGTSGVGVTGPGSSTNNDFASFSGTSGTTLQDSGKVAPSGAVLGTTDTQTLTNKRITQRVITAADATTITPNTDNADVTYQSNSQGAGTLTIANDAGTPTDGQHWILKINACVSSGGTQTYSWNARYVSGSDVVLPTVTSCVTPGTNLIDQLGFIYDLQKSKWELVAVARGY